MYFFDASSLFNLVKKAKLLPLAEGATLDLALYEALNAAWKEHVLPKKLGSGTALELVSLIKGAFKAVQVDQCGALRGMPSSRPPREGLLFTTHPTLSQL